jgi:hypothetical protein
MMKLIKLDGRHNLYHKGYRYAFRVNRWTTDAHKIEKAVKELEGYHWDNTFWGKQTNDNGWPTRPYYIGIKNESTATMAMLKL